MTKELLIQYSKSPSAISSEQQAELHELLAKYPYSNLLQLLAACSEEQQHSKLAIAYTSEQALKKAKNYSFLSLELEEATEAIQAHTPTDTDIKIQRRSRGEEKTEIETESEHAGIEMIVAQENIAQNPTILQTAVPLPKESIFKLDVNKEIEEQELEGSEPEVESFTDWLKKTRLAKETIEQSPIKLDESAPIATGSPDELEKLYQENMYHLEALDEQQASKFANTNAIIERFIIEDPHLKPIDEASPSTDNKAKKSVELPNSLITETLAQIYISQKYYSKAIMAYEKLSLKFPEKSAYFATLIQKIKSENQIN